MNVDLKTIGLLGGMAWPSTQDYYYLLNTEIEKRLGFNHSAKCIIYSYDFNSINPTFRNSEEITNQLETGINSLQAASADIILLCSNTIHKFLDKIKDRFSEDLFLDVRDCVGSYLTNSGIKNCLLLGTRFTMSEPFYGSYLSTKYDVNVIVPDREEQLKIHSLIFEELVNNIVSEKSIDFFKKIVTLYKVDAIILACTELRMVFNNINTSKIIVDSTKVHASAAIDIIIK
ncbi:MAG TPA: amino acid racemase [Chitinophagaceae bacterium]|nr:amino acid racemase [Chitinophagaceae bacterium]